MAHFAHINANNIVDKVIVAEHEYINSGRVGSSSEWIQTSYNTHGGIHYSQETNLPDDGIPLRKNFAGIGFTYDSALDAFIPPKPTDGEYTLNESTCLWEPVI